VIGVHPIVISSLVIISILVIILTFEAVSLLLTVFILVVILILFAISHLAVAFVLVTIERISLRHQRARCTSILHFKSLND
jgi:hypothetical protein